MVKVMQQQGNVAPNVEECYYARPAEHELVHWCHGAPGKGTVSYAELLLLKRCLRGEQTLCA